MILHVIDNLRPESGGPTAVVTETVCRQARDFGPVTVLCREVACDEAARTRLNQLWQGLPVRLIECGNASMARQVASAMRSVSPSVVHVHYGWERIIRVALKCAQELGIRTVVSTHGMFHPYALGVRKFKKAVYLWCFANRFRGVAMYLALNEEEQIHLSRVFRWPATVLPNGVECDNLPGPDLGIFRRTVPRLGAKPFALFVGRLHPIKGIDLLLRSFALAVDGGIPLDLVILGPDEGELPALQAQARQLNIQERTHFVGGVYGAMKIEALRECSVFVHRPRFEGFGIAVVEAMAAGKPSITTANCRLPEAARAGALAVAADSDTDFASALLEIAQDTSRAQDLARRGRDWAVSNASWSRILGTLQKMYQTSSSRT